MCGARDPKQKPHQLNRAADFARGGGRNYPPRSLKAASVKVYSLNPKCLSRWHAPCHLRQHAAESKRGQHSQSTAPFLETSAAVSQSPMSA
jgi:hypothetical protein